MGNTSYDEAYWRYINEHDNRSHSPYSGRAERAEIARIYGKEYVAAGDKVRMKLALASPGLYYRIVKLYDKFVIPLRSGK